MDRPLFAPRIVDDAAYLPDNAAGGISNVSGFAEGSFSYGRESFRDENADIRNWSLRGSVNVDLNNGFNTQFDGGYHRGDVKDTSQANTLNGALHAYYRVPDAYAVGAFAGAARLGSSLFNFAERYYGLDKYATDLIGGVEGAVYSSDATLYSRIGYGRASYSGLDMDHFTTALGARVYADDNTRYDFEGTFNRLTAYGASADLYSLSAIANYRITDTPVTAFAGYRYDRRTVDSQSPLEGHSVLTGLRVHFGSGTLKDEERRGPAWNSPMSSF
ncbi:hypothetical protein [Phyllobacterium salinisoli]|nr:hypothetical protein [Phyllobacterium salinisoli]